MRKLLRTILAAAALVLAYRGRADDSLGADHLDKAPVVIDQVAPEYPFSPCQ